VARRDIDEGAQLMCLGSAMELTHRTAGKLQGEYGAIASKVRAILAETDPEAARPSYRTDEGDDDRLISG
jgi:hypothetical protein